MRHANTEFSQSGSWLDIVNIVSHGTVYIDADTKDKPGCDELVIF